MSSDRLRKQANGTDVTSKRHEKRLPLKLTEEASKRTEVTSKRHAKGHVLRLTKEASKQNGRDFEKARIGACHQTD